MLKPGFWGDQGAAGKVVAVQKRARAIVGPMRHADSTMEDLEVLLELAEEDEAAVTADIEEALSALEEGLDKAEFQLMLGGEHDHRNAILNLQAGAGGVDSDAIAGGAAGDCRSCCWCRWWRGGDGGGDGIGTGWVADC